RRALQCTLFPYPTLFRSFWSYIWERDRWEQSSKAAQPTLSSDREAWVWASEQPRAATPIPRAASPLVAAVGDERAISDALRDREDRKSTRLNSSHVKISY